MGDGASDPGRPAAAIPPLLALLACAAAALPPMAAWDSYRFARTGETFGLLLLPLSAMACFALATLCGVLRAAQLLHARRLRGAAAVLFAAGAVAASVHVFLVPLAGLPPSPFTGGAMTRRGTLDRIRAAVAPDELVAWARTVDEAAVKDRSRWPAWLARVGPDGVYVRSYCAGGCRGVELIWGGSMIGHWGVAVLPPGGDGAFAPGDRVAPAIYWQQGP